MCAVPSSRSKNMMYHDAKQGPSCLMSMKKPVLHESFISWHQDWYVILFLPQTWSPLLPCCMERKNKYFIVSFTNARGKRKVINESLACVISHSIHHCRRLHTHTQCRTTFNKPFSRRIRDHINYRTSSLLLPPGSLFWLNFLSTRWFSILFFSAFVLLVSFLS